MSTIAFIDKAPDAKLLESVAISAASKPYRNLDEDSGNEAPPLRKRLRRVSVIVSDDNDDDANDANDTNDATDTTETDFLIPLPLPHRAPRDAVARGAESRRRVRARDAVRRRRLGSDKHVKAIEDEVTAACNKLDTAVPYFVERCDELKELGLHVYTTTDLEKTYSAVKELTKFKEIRGALEKMYGPGSGGAASIAAEMLNTYDGAVLDLARIAPVFRAIGGEPPVPIAIEYARDVPFESIVADAIADRNARASMVGLKKVLADAAAILKSESEPEPESESECAGEDVPLKITESERFAQAMHAGVGSTRAPPPRAAAVLGLSGMRRKAEKDSVDADEAEVAKNKEEAFYELADERLLCAVNKTLGCMSFAFAVLNSRELDDRVTLAEVFRADGDRTVEIAADDLSMLNYIRDGHPARNVLPLRESILAYNKAVASYQATFDRVPHSTVSAIHPGRMVSIDLDSSDSALTALSVVLKRP